MHQKTGNRQQNGHRMTGNKKIIENEDKMAGNTYRTTGNTGNKTVVTLQEKWKTKESRPK